MFEQTFKNFNINLNVLNERNTFSSGEPVTGHFSFDLTKETKITSITAVLEGKANVHWSSGGGGGKKRRRRNFAAKLEFFNLKAVIMQRNGATDEAVKLQPGTHMYPFTCQLPQGDFPSSFHGLHGKIAYNLTLGINRPWHMSKDFTTELNFVNSINANQPALQSPLSGSNKMTVCCLWCASRPITMTASMEKKGYIPGETVKIICEFSNGSSRTATPKVRLQQKQVYYTKNKVNKREYCKNLVSVAGEPICSHASDVHTEITLTIPSSASPTISNCSILVVDYLIEVNLTGWAFPELTVLFPIILCDTPVGSPPPPCL
ncbi:arrestin domain-containing protein 3-like [Seriola lalandi dorsalis]|uniref:Arrestin domain-containing protein 3-like n=1 Tax=Seriola lalandi dorsalis TaxID=1841481 RepID=A0A3B4X002_SERLL|nr:arrestin domain-containing protein 3-like [Seriola lalandi dorsalis]XP_056231336.1 arrestin domain-containing protein 3-like [Seriola aureovittata]